METVIKVPDDWLYTQWQRAQMALVHYGSDKLQKQYSKQTTLTIIPVN